MNQPLNSQSVSVSLLILLMYTIHGWEVAEYVTTWCDKLDEKFNEVPTGSFKVVATFVIRME